MASKKPQIEDFEPRIVPATWASLDVPVESQLAASIEFPAWSIQNWNQDTSLARSRFGLYGYGQTVAIIDSGIAYDHHALGGGFGTSHRVVGGWDFAENDNDPYDDDPMGFHGTHVAGIVGSSDEVYPGVAPGVDLVALRVFDDFGNGNSSWITEALTWVHRHKHAFRYPITTVNLSLGIPSVNAVTRAQIDSALSLLRDDGIFISVAAGNGFSGNTQLMYPASSSLVTPVASVGPNGSLSNFSMRHPRILAAPGEMITSTVPDYLFGFNGVTDDFLAASGTSMAAPQVAGASVLLREVLSNLGQGSSTQDQLYDHLFQTADRVFDPLTQSHYHRLNLRTALEKAIGPDEDAHGSPVFLGSISKTLSFDGTINYLGDVDRFSFFSSQSGVVTLESDWTAAANVKPDVNLKGAAQIAPGRFQVTAGQTYEVHVADRGSIGRYAGRLTLQPTKAPTMAAAPASNANQSHQVWTATATGVHQIMIQVAAPQRVNEVHITNDLGQTVFRTSSVQRQINLQIAMNAGESLHFAFQGFTPSLDVSVSAVKVHGVAQPGTDSNTTTLAAIFVPDLFQRHSAAFADKPANQASHELADSEQKSLITAVEPAWLHSTIKARALTNTSSGREADETTENALIAAAFAESLAELTSSWP